MAAVDCGFGHGNLQPPSANDRRGDRRDREGPLTRGPVSRPPHSCRGRFQPETWPPRHRPPRHRPRDMAPEK